MKALKLSHGEIHRGMPIRIKYTFLFIAILAAVLAAMCLMNATQLGHYTVRRKQVRIEETIEAIGKCADAGFAENSTTSLDVLARNNNLDITVLRAADQGNSDQNIDETPAAESGAEGTSAASDSTDPESSGNETASANESDGETGAQGGSAGKPETFDIFTDSSYVIYSTNLRQALSIQMIYNYYGGSVTINSADIYKKTDQYVIYRTASEKRNGYEICSIGLTGTGYYYIISTPMASIQESVSLSNQFLLIIGLFALVAGGIIIYLVTRSLTKPILQISRISQKVSRLDFSERYDGKINNEIGILGKNINQMSDSLRRSIDELRSANAQLEKDLKEKDQIDEMRRLFLSNVSHELKTPIALIQGYAEGLQDGITDDPESMQYYCEVIVDEAQKMNAIVRRLLNLDEIESGQMQIAPEVFNLADLVRSGVESTKVLASDKQVEWKVNSPDEVLVLADTFMIESVLQNYLSNACHYVSDPGTITVSVLPDGDQVIVSVHDTGPEIPAEDIDHVWDKFYKVDKARTRAYGGSGIGLSIVKAIIRAHGTRCGVIDRDGGVDFWFELQHMTREQAQKYEESQQAGKTDEPGGASQIS